MEMDAARWERIQSLFHQALALPEHERTPRLVFECAGDPGLLADVLALLDADARGGSLLERNLAQVAQEVLDEPLPALRTVGPYRILRRLGTGGMGVVYLGEHEELHHHVAIKLLRDASLSPARRERFAREQKTLAQLNHPGIARLYDASVLPDGAPYFVMEYVAGEPITDFCEAHRCPVAERLRLFRAVCESVQQAHRQAVIHRDLKPSNVLVTAGRGTGEPAVKLLDFGIAKQLDELDAPADLTQTALRLLTPAYAAPEQLRGQPVGVYTDVHALGVILYELLTGQHPFAVAGLTAGQVEARILEEHPEKPSTKARPAAAGGPAGVRTSALSSTEWADLDVLCLTAMHSDPQRRYATVEALMRDLDHFGRGEPLEAQPDTLRYRTGKFLRRHRRPAAAAALVAALIVGLVGFYTVRLTEQRNLAYAEAEKAAQISSYLIGLFEAGDPYAAEAETLDVRALLDRGARRAEELAGQPTVQAAMLDVLGRVHTQLSEFDRAEPLLRRALALRREHAAPLDVAESLSSLAGLFIDTGDYDGAESALREALALRERILPPNHSELATNLANLGSVHGYKGQYEEAEALHRVALRMRRANHGPLHEEIGSSLNALAVAVYNQGRYTDAERYYREALAVNQAAFGREHASVTRITANLGKLYEELGDYAAADSLLTEALRIRRATLGNDHFETAIGLGQIAGLYNVMGDHERAEPYLRESLAIRERILPPNHQSIGTTANGLALALQHRGEFDEAEALFRRAVGIYRESLGERHRFTGVALCNLAHILLLKGEPAAADAYFREGVSVLEEVHPEDHQELAHNRVRHGAALVALRRFEEAEALLVPAYRMLNARLGAEHARTGHAAERLVELYEAWGWPEQGEPYRLALSQTGAEGRNQ